MPTESGFNSNLSYCASEVQRHDSDRFRTAMFAPPALREGLFSLYAFNLEVAKIREVVSEPMLGEIRLQWWREAIDGIYGGTPRRHAVVEPLSAVIAGQGLTRENFDRLIDARTFDLSDEPPATLDDLIDYAEGTSVTLVLLALESLGTSTDDTRKAARHVGIAWALTGLLRAIPFHSTQRRQYLPEEVIARHGVKRRDLMELRQGAEISAAVSEIVELARRHLGEARAAKSEIPRTGLAALLPAVVAELHLGRLERVGFDPFDSRLAAAARFDSLRLAVRVLLGRY